MLSRGPWEKEPLLLPLLLCLLAWVTGGCCFKGSWVTIVLLATGFP